MKDLKKKVVVMNNWLTIELKILWVKRWKYIFNYNFKDKNIV